MRKRTSTLLLASLMLLAAPSPGGTNEARLKSYGRHLSSECSACHRLDGVDNGIPSITGLPVEEFVATLRFYRDGARPNPVMVSVARSLDEEQMEALAHYYGSLPKQRPQSAPGAKK
jgi:cytochrome c